MYALSQFRRVRVGDVNWGQVIGWEERLRNDRRYFYVEWNVKLQLNQ